MTITLHWWMVPAALVLLGVCALIRAPSGLEGLAHGFVGTVMFGLAFAVCLGHWL